MKSQLQQILKRVSEKFLLGSLAVGAAIASFVGIFLEGPWASVCSMVVSVIAIIVAFRDEFLGEDPASTQQVDALSSKFDELMGKFDSFDFASGELDKIKKELEESRLYAPNVAIQLALSGDIDGSIRELKLFLEKTELPETVRVSLCTLLFLIARVNRPDVAIEALSIILNYDESILYLHQMGVSQDIAGSIPLALEYFEKVLQKIPTKKSDLERAIFVATLNSKAISLIKMGDYVEAEATALASLAEAEETGDLNSVGRACGTLGNLYRRKEDYSIARQFKLRALRIATILKDVHVEASTIGDIGLIAKHEGNIAEASDAFWIALGISIRSHALQVVADQFGNLANLCIPNNLGLAERLFTQSASIDEYIRRPLKLGQTYMNLAILKDLMQQPYHAMKFANMAKAQFAIAGYKPGINWAGAFKPLAGDPPPKYPTHPSRSSHSPE